MLEANDYERMTPEQHVEAWTSMGPPSDRARILKVLDEAERVVRGMGSDLEHLRHPERWDDLGPEYGDALEYLRDRLENVNEAPYVLARLGELRRLIDRILPPQSGM